MPPIIAARKANSERSPCFLMATAAVIKAIIPETIPMSMVRARIGLSRKSSRIELPTGVF